ncbi:MAG: hypothetical protein AAF693_11850 [Bacteroidota bacterium]
MKKVFLLFFLLVFSSSFSQTLDEQFNKLKDDAETFKVYKVIKQTELNTFWTTVSDSVTELKRKVQDAGAEIQQQSNIISQQKDILQSKDEEIASLQYNTSHISVLGIDFVKEAFIAISFSIIGVLIAGLIFVFTRFKNSQVIAKQKVGEWKKLNDEYEGLKKDSLEKQMKLRRELQTYINKLNEIRST